MPRQPSNAESPIATTEDGIETFWISTQPLNALLPMYSMPLDTNVIALKLMQFLNAPSSTAAILAVISDKVTQFLNASCPT